MNKIIKGLISITVLCLIFYSIDFELLKTTNFYFSQSNLLLLLVLLISSLFIRSYRWSILMNDTKVTVSQKESFKLLLVGSSLNIFLPSGTGDIVKSYYGFKWTGIKEQMLYVSLLDKLIAIGSIIFITPFAFYNSGNSSILIAGVFSIIPFLVLIYFKKLKEFYLFGLLYNFIYNKLKKINLELLIENIQVSKTKIFFSFCLSIVGWIFSYTLLFLCFEVVFVTVPYSNVICFIPFLTLGRLFPFTLNGIGSDEALIVFLFSSHDSTKEAVLIAALLYRIIIFFIPAILGLIILLLKK